MAMVIFLTIPLITHAQTVTIVGATNHNPGAVSFDIDFAGFAGNGGSVYLQIEYDSDLLKYTGFNSTQDFSINPNFEKSVIAMSWAAGDPAGVNLNGTFLSLNFTYYGGFPNTLMFIESKCEIAGANLLPITGITYVNGSITPNLLNPNGIAKLGIVDAIAGGDAAIPLELTNVDGFDEVESITFRIGYDTEKLVYSGISDNLALGFTAGEEDGVITLAYNGVSPLNFPFSDPVVDLNFNYLGGGIAEVVFLSGSYATDTDGTILVTLFENGQVNPSVGSGTLTIQSIIAEPGEVEIEITAAGIPSIPAAGVIEIRIAHDGSLVYKEFSSGAFPNGWTSSPEPGYLTFIYTNNSGFTIGAGELLTLIFDYSGGIANITFEAGTYLKDTDGNPIPVGLENGLVTPSIYVNTKVYLQGPWNGTNMNTTLLTDGFLPLGQPYNVAPWNYGGGENVASMPAGVVDWILLELRSDETTMVAQRAGFLLSDGRVMDLDGVSPLAFDNVQPDEYYIVIKHRNHLAIMSATAQPLSGGSVLYDFTSAVTQSYDAGYSTLPLADLSDGNWGMLAGDGDGSGDIDSYDVTYVWLPDRLKIGYFAGDFNLDTEVDSFDVSYLWLPNRLKITHVPN